MINNNLLIGQIKNRATSSALLLLYSDNLDVAIILCRLRGCGWSLLFLGRRRRKRFLAKKRLQARLDGSGFLLLWYHIGACTLGNFTILSLGFLLSHELHHLCRVVYCVKFSSQIIDTALHCSASKCF